MEIIGREKELEILESALLSREAEMLAVYGRRRIGKTFLISEFYKNKTIMFNLVGVAKAPADQQLKGFSLALAKAFLLSQIPPRPKSWFDAFALLEKYLRNYRGKKKITLFFDELPWLSGQSPNMLRWLEHFWNSFACHEEKIILVLCGSAASWMIKKIVRNTKGLYGRLTHKIHLQPFTIQETARYLIAKNLDISPRHLIELYLVTGGVAKYLNHIPRALSSSEIIQELCFSQQGFLQGEFRELFASLFENSERHLDVIRTLARSHYGMTKKEISQKTSISSGGRLAETLEELEASGFVTNIPYFQNKKRNAVYRVIDEYTLFYIRWIEPSFSVHNKPLSDSYWMSTQSSQAYKTWAGYAFENFCIKHIADIVGGLKISVVACGLWQWRHVPKKDDGTQGAQIDLIIERRDQCLHLCEVKFSSDPFNMTSTYSQKLLHKKEIFREVTGYSGSLFTTLLTCKKSKRNPPYLSAINQEFSVESLLT